ncbi:MAG TPA: hypothetical protein PLK30_26045, partial [Blastocatellia bacterium]|nr:hypothetical protein [Blastocatellia bacterium]
MLQTVKAEVRADGTVRLLEPLHVTQTSPAIVTLLSTENGTIPPKGNVLAVLQFLRENRLPESALPTADEIEAQILEAR